MIGIKELARLLPDTNIIQEDIAKYLGITRQSLSKIFNGEYVQTSEYTKRRFVNLLKDEKLNLEYAKIYIKTHKTLQILIDDLSKMEKTEIDDLNQLIKYVMYWIDKDNREEYMHKLYIHIQNFHLRINPYYLYFKEYFHKDLQPVLTFQIDYKRHQVYDIVLGNIVNSDYMQRNYNLNYQNIWDAKFEKEMSFDSFVNALSSFYDGKLRYIIYSDNIDDEISYIQKNIKKGVAKQLEQVNFLDISNIFRINSGTYRLEDLLKNYLPNLEERKILRDSYYRNNNIIKMIRKLCHYDIEKTHDINSILKTVDSEKYNKDKAENVEVVERRKKRDKFYERN